MGTTTSDVAQRDTTPDPALVGSDVNALFQGMTNGVIARQQQRQLPLQLVSGYQPPIPTALQPPPPVTPPTPGPQMSPAPWAQPQQSPLSSPSQVAINTPQVRLTPQVVPPQPAPLTGERPPLNNMPPLWNGNATGPSGQTKQQFLLQRLQHESQGDPTALNYLAKGDPRAWNQGRTATGLLQDVSTTWANGVRWAKANPDQYPMNGEDPSKYSEARYAPWWVQWQVNSAIYDHAGETPWKEQNGGFRGNAALRSDSYQPPDQRTPHQNYLPAEPRGFQQWGQDPSGDPARPEDTGGIFSKFAPLLLGIASLALRLPLSTAVAAYGAMAQAQQNGQNEAYERNRTKYQDAWKEASAKQNLESQEYGDAFATYGENNPQGLQQQLANIALKYNDPQMLRLAEQGNLNGAHQLQAQRDMLNQNLVKGSKALEEQQDRQAEDAAVAAMDRKWREENPNASDAEFAIAHNEHIGQAARAGSKDPKAAGAEKEEAKVYNVVDKDTGKPTGKQVRVGQSGGMFDLDGKPTTLAPNEKLGDEAGVKAGADKPEQEGEVRNVVGPDGKPTGQQVREGKTGGYFDPDSGERVHLKPGETIAQPDRTGAGDSLEVSKPYDIVDDKGHVVKPNVMLREARNKAGYVHSEDGSPLQLEPGQSVKQITPTTSGGGRAGAQVLRQLVGGREVLSDLQNVVRLPIGTTIGPLGTAQPGHSVIDALTGDLTRKLTNQDSQLMQASMASMTRELSILMSPVYGGNYAAQQIEPLIPKTGDTMQTVIFKLARLAQSADNALEAASKSPILSGEEQEYAKDMRQQLKEAIPWSSAEAMDFAYRGHPKESFGDYVKRQGIGSDDGGGSRQPQQPDWAKQSATGPDGQKIYSPDGKTWFHPDHTPVQ